MLKVQSYLTFRRGLCRRPLLEVHEVVLEYERLARALAVLREHEELERLRRAHVCQLVLELEARLLTRHLRKTKREWRALIG